MLRASVYPLQLMPLSTNGCTWCQSTFYSFRNSLSLPSMELADFRAPLTSNLMLLESNRSSGKHETCLPSIYLSWHSSYNTRHDAHVITLLMRHRRTVFIVHRLRPNYFVNICGESRRIDTNEITWSPLLSIRQHVHHTRVNKRHSSWG